MAATCEVFAPGDDRPVKIFFEDEGRFGRIDRPYYCWAPPGIRPVIPTQIIREYTHAFSAVCPMDGEVFSLILPYANTEAMKIFLLELSQEYSGYRIIMVMDKAAWHCSKAINDFENIRFLYQPPYSPEVNPVEHLWEYLRENFFKNHSWNSIEELERSLASALKEIRNIKSIIQSLVGFYWTLI